MGKNKNKLTVLIILLALAVALYIIYSSNILAETTITGEYVPNPVPYLDYNYQEFAVPALRIQNVLAIDYSVLYLVSDVHDWLDLDNTLIGKDVRVIYSVINEYEDLSGNIFKEVTVESIEVFGTPISELEFYVTEDTTDILAYVNWGKLQPSETKTITFYIRNNGVVPLQLHFEATNFNPVVMQSYLNVYWNQEDVILEPNNILVADVTLEVSPTVQGNTYSFDITVAGVSVN